MRWMLGVVAALGVGLLGVVSAMFIFLRVIGWTHDLKSTQSSRRVTQHRPHVAK